MNTEINFQKECSNQCKKKKYNKKTNPRKQEAQQKHFNLLISA